MCRKQDKFCSRVVDSELMRVEFWRRPFVYTLFVRKLWEMVDQCRCHQPSCPDVVVLNSAIWYCRKVWLTQAIHKSVTFWMLKLREDMDNLREVLMALTMETTVIWRLEEAITSDVTNLLRKSEFQKRLSASHALAYDLFKQVDELVVWSSMLAETFDFAQRVCGSVKSLIESEDPAVEDIFDQCDDEIHVGTTMRQRFVSMLLDALCESDGIREKGHCCRD
ncbi:uncharacterized protein LOC119099316 [Pollicipes pollicipes]|uniref:uncharacterized protein LOC119099316 n=1 Tax=Pollicipes pollicipes TaxID=41117 RepID=UPI00188501DF|nr:uncharacterized protein LOC119099316 [Pollicipes pollicipes]